MKLMLTYGPPGSGKSTWATNQVKKLKGKTVIVNLDDLRATMFGTLDNYKFNNDNENYINYIETEQVKKLAASGTNVIISDTNMNPKVLQKWRTFAKENGCHFTVHDFFEEFCTEREGQGVTMLKYFHLKAYRKRCKEWNLKRLKSVPEDVIDMMFDKYLLPKYELTKHVYDPELPWCVVSDVDGTLMHMGTRNPYDETKVLEDTPDYSVCEVVKSDFEKYYGFIFSGRHVGCKEDTLKSLELAGVVPNETAMRADDDSRSDDIVKYELYLKHIHGKYNILRWYDDRQQVVRVLRDMGIKVFAVADGNF